MKLNVKLKDDGGFYRNCFVSICRNFVRLFISDLEFFPPEICVECSSKKPKNTASKYWTRVRISFSGNPILYVWAIADNDPTGRMYEVHRRLKDFLMKQNLLPKGNKPRSIYVRIFVP